MFYLSELKQTRFYQQAKEEGRQEALEEYRREGKLEVVPLLVELGLSVEEVAEKLNLDIEEVRKAAKVSSADN